MAQTSNPTGENENTLKESEDKYLSLYNNNHLIMMLIDPESETLLMPISQPVIITAIYKRDNKQKYMTLMCFQ